MEEKFFDSQIGRLKIAKVKKNLSYQNIGDKIGVSKQQVCNYFEGKTPIKRSTLEKLAQALEVNIDWLELESENPKTNIAQEDEAPAYLPQYVFEERQRFARQITELILLSGIKKQKDIGEYLGIAESDLSALLGGHRQLSSSNLRHFAKAGLNVMYTITGKGEYFEDWLIEKLRTNVSILKK